MYLIRININYINNAISLMHGKPPPSERYRLDFVLLQKAIQLQNVVFKLPYCLLKALFNLTDRRNSFCYVVLSYFLNIRGKQQHITVWQKQSPFPNPFKRKIVL